MGNGNGNGKSKRQKALRLANAFKLVAVANHAMIGVVGAYSDDEYKAARAELMAELKTFAEGTELHRRVALAMVLLEATASQPATGTMDQRIWKKEGT
jgi:uncharacterized membrane protein